MNEINWREPAEVTMDLTPTMEKLITDVFNIEMEIMQGETESLGDGRNRITIKVEGEKAEMIGKFILSFISRRDEINLN